MKKSFSVAPVIIFLLAFALTYPAGSAHASSYLYTFNSAGTLYEAGTISNSTSPYWWVNSGAKLLIDGVHGSTVQGSLSGSDPWRLIYASANPLDTDNGYHPQNIFRLVSKSMWDNYSEHAYFDITKTNVSASPNRDGYNGLLLFNRYALDGQTLYYAGVRTDGTAVIKKKYHGTYYTMAQVKLFPGTYNRDTNPQLLPQNKWIGLRTDVVTNGNGSVNVTLYTDLGWAGTWSKVLSATDSGQYAGTPPITGGGYVGIRTDFMDVVFDNFGVMSL